MDNRLSAGQTFAYDSENHLKPINGGAVTLLYDDDGNRVAKTVSESHTLPGGRSEPDWLTAGGRRERQWCRSALLYLWPAPHRRDPVVPIPNWNRHRNLLPKPATYTRPICYAESRAEYRFESHGTSFGGFLIAKSFDKTFLDATYLE